MKCVLSRTTAGLILLLGQNLLYANSERSGAASVNFETDLSYLQQLGQDKFKSNPISLTVKVYENGDVYIDKLNYASIRYQEKFDNGNVEVKADILGFYKEEIQRQIGYEQGVRYVDLEVAKVIKLNENDDITYRIEGYFKLDKDNHITLSDENQLNVDNYLNKDYRATGTKPEYGVGVSAHYDMGDGEVSVRATFMNTEASYNNDDIEDQRYDFSNSEKRVEFSYRPDKKKCHTYRVGVKALDINQGINGVENNLNDTEVYAEYSCKFDLWKLMFSETDTSNGSLIRY